MKPGVSKAMRLALPLLSLLVGGAGHTYNFQVQGSGFGLPVPPEPPMSGPPPKYQPAPLPNRDVELAKPRASTATTVSPSLFTRPDEYRGDGFSKGSTAQSEEEKRVKPGAGLSLHMPLSPN